MARLSLAEMQQKASNQGNGERKDFKYVNSFFLSNDRDSKRAIILLPNAEAVDSYSTHTVVMPNQKTGKSNFHEISCLESTGVICPLCAEAAKNDPNNMHPKISKKKDNIFLPLAVKTVEDGTIRTVFQVWKRNVGFYTATLSGQSARCVPLCGKEFDIERAGAKGDSKTVYNLYPCDVDLLGSQYEKVTADKLEAYKESLGIEKDDIFGRMDSYIKNWTPEMMEQYISTGTYPRMTIRNDAPPEPETVEEQHTAEETASQSNTEQGATPRQRTNHGF